MDLNHNAEFHEGAGQIINPQEEGNGGRHHTEGDDGNPKIAQIVIIFKI